VGNEKFGVEIVNMKNVIMLNHVIMFEDGSNDTKLIGFFSSMEKVEEVIGRYKLLNGFKEHPNDFKTKICMVDVDDFNETAVDLLEDEVYYLAHEYYDGVEFDYVTDLGVYSTLEKAKQSMKKFKRRVQFKDYKDGFSIDCYKIDNDYWYFDF